MVSISKHGTTYPSNNKPCITCNLLCCLCLSFAGYYWIDPNEGCTSDAEYIYCDFENKRACVQPKKENVSLPHQLSYSANRLTVNFQLIGLQSTLRSTPRYFGGLVITYRSWSPLVQELLKISPTLPLLWTLSITDTKAWSRWCSLLKHLTVSGCDPVIFASFIKCLPWSERFFFILLRTKFRHRCRRFVAQFGLTRRKNNLCNQGIKCSFKCLVLLQKL